MEEKKQKKKDLDREIGARIRKVRNDRGFTQEQLAGRIGVTVQFVSDIERGVCGASLGTIVKLCKILHVSSDQLLLGDSREKAPREECDVLAMRIRDLGDKERAITMRALDLLEEAFEQ